MIARYSIKNFSF